MRVVPQNPVSERRRGETQDLSMVDLFCGCGGMSLGFQNAGFEIIGAFDHWEPAIEVYGQNFEHPVSQLDLGNGDAQEIIADLQPQILVGGPPCQDFSSAGPANLGSKRAGLAASFIDIIEAAKPKFIVLENVPRIRLKPIFSEIESRLRRLGYGLSSKVLDAAYCGVPQRRKRFFLVGELGGPDDFLEFYLQSAMATEELTMREYFGPELDTDYYFRVPTNYSRRGVFSVDEPSVTIRGVDRPIPKGYPRHPDDPVPIGPKVRALSVLERSYIQTFPKSFVFSGNKTNLNTMIGNAVPVKLAEFVASALSIYIENQHGI